MKGTKTQNFGSSKRENHDASQFYGSKLYESYNIKEKNKIYENVILPKILNTIVCKDSRNLSFIPDESIHLMITSPPYNVTKEYDENLSLREYLQMIKDVMEEVFRVLVTGGRACINIANIGRKPYLPLNSYINNLMIDIGFYMRGEIIWNKSASAGTSTAWGSWKSASNPTLRDVHEYILVYSKGQFGRKRDKTLKQDTISKEEFLDFTKSVWSFPTASAKKVGHPAPFPLELPRRLIQFYSFTDDVILDPFVGSGTTALAAIKLKRNYIGIDINQEYCELSKSKIDKIVNQTKLEDYF